MAATLQSLRQGLPASIPAAELPPEEQPLTLDAETTETLVSMQRNIANSLKQSLTLRGGGGEEQTVPEPAAAALTLLGVAALTHRRRRSHK